MKCEFKMLFSKQQWERGGISPKRGNRDSEGDGSTEKEDGATGVVPILNDLRMVSVDFDARTSESPRFLHLVLFLVQIILLRNKKRDQAYGGHCCRLEWMSRAYNYLLRSFCWFLAEEDVKFQTQGRRKKLAQWVGVLLCMECCTHCMLGYGMLKLWVKGKGLLSIGLIWNCWANGIGSAEGYGIKAQY